MFCRKTKAQYHADLDSWRSRHLTATKSIADLGLNGTSYAVTLLGAYAADIFAAEPTPNLQALFDSQPEDFLMDSNEHQASNGSSSVLLIYAPIRSRLASETSLMGKSTNELALASTSVNKRSNSKLALPSAKRLRTSTGEVVEVIDLSD